MGTIDELSLTTAEIGFSEHGLMHAAGWQLCCHCAEQRCSHKLVLCAGASYLQAVYLSGSSAFVFWTGAMMGSSLGSEARAATLLKLYPDRGGNTNQNLSLHFWVTRRAPLWFSGSVLFVSLREASHRL